MQEVSETIARKAAIRLSLKTMNLNANDRTGKAKSDFIEGWKMQTRRFFLNTVLCPLPHNKSSSFWFGWNSAHAWNQYGE